MTPGLRQLIAAMLFAILILSGTIIALQFHT